MALPELTNENIDEVLSHVSTVTTLAADVEIATTPEVETMLAAMEATGFMFPFDWMEEFNSRREDLESYSVVAESDLELLRKIMTAHVRIDRFDEGHLDGLIQSGYWSRCFGRLQQLRNER